jgi:hypothetical protein
VARLGGREDPELRHVRDADDHEARLLEPPHEVRAVPRAVVGEQLRAEGHRQPGDRHVRLDRDRDAGERPLVARLDLVGGGECAVRVDLDESVHGRIERLDARERRRRHLARAQLAPADVRSEIPDRHEHELLHPPSDTSRVVDTASKPVSSAFKASDFPRQTCEPSALA